MEGLAPSLTENDVRNILEGTTPFRPKNRCCWKTDG